MVHAARALGLGVMLGCMVESGLGIAPGAHIASLMDHVDLDGNLLLAVDPWPGVEFRRRRPAARRTRRGSVLRPRRLLILAEGRSDDPHYGKTARGVIRYRPGGRRRRPRLATAPATSTRASRSSRTVAEATGVRADGRARRCRNAGRAVPAGVARAAEGVRSRPGSTSRTACTSSSRTIPSSIGLARGARRRAARPAQGAGRPQRPDRRRT